MPLNYSKWDQLELSDDSDIEGHPNVDHKSLVRWKQRDIHEKREARKHLIAHLEAQIACNKVLLPRITEVSDKLKNTSDSIPRSKYFSNLVEKLGTSPSRDCPPGNDPTKIEQTYDGMLLQLLRQVSAEAQKKLDGKTLTDAGREEKLAHGLAEGMEFHVTHLGETIQKDQEKLEAERTEQHKKITMDDIHTAWDSQYVTPQADLPPVPKSKISKPTTTQKVTELETLNPKSVETAEIAHAVAAQQTVTPSAGAGAGNDEDEEGLPELTPALEEFSHLPLKAYQKSFMFIQAHRDVFAPGSSDALLVAAFRAQSNDKPKYAKKCIHQSLLLQYCDKLGPDGVRLFFNKMIAGDQRAQKVFVDDVESTYHHLVERVNISKAETEAESAGQEQIQLVAEDPDVTISFNVPDGPPPENLVLEGPGTEDMDIEEVRKVLQLRWDMFSSFPEAFRDALKTNELAEVNKILGSMPVDEAEQLVQQLEIAGILNFAEGGIRDETGKGEQS